MMKMCAIPVLPWGDYPHTNFFLELFVAAIDGVAIDGVAIDGCITDGTQKS